MAIIRIDVAESISSNPFALQQVVDQIIDQIDDLNTGATGSGGGGGDGDIYTLTATDGDGEVTVNLIADEGANSDVVLRAGNGMTINESGGTITFTAADGPDLGNYVTVNSSTGEIQAGTTTFQYLYRYLHIGFATDADGTDFTTDPATITGTEFYIGTFNSSSLTPPADATSYSYRQFTWSSEHNVFLRTVGGHQIEFLTSLQAIIPDASPYNADSDNPLDFDILQINNGNISDGAVSVEKLSIDQLSAITADVGDLSAGVIRGGNLTGADPANNADGAFGSYMSLTNGDVLFGDATSHLRYDATDDEISLIGDLATTNEITWVPNNTGNNQRLMVNSNTFSNETDNRNTHYAADGLASTTDGNFFVGHIETPINDSTRAGDPKASTGIEISTITTTIPGIDEEFNSTIMSNYGSVFFNPAGDSNGFMFWVADNSELRTFGGADIQATKYEDRGLSNAGGNTVFLATDSEDRIIGNAAGGFPLDFTQFATGKFGSTSGQAVLSNNQDLTLPAGTYAISLEELAAARRHTIFDLGGMVGQVSGEDYQLADFRRAFIRFNGETVSSDTVINDATSSNGEAYITMQRISEAQVDEFIFLFGGDDGYDSVITPGTGFTLKIDPTRTLDVSVVLASDSEFQVDINEVKSVLIFRNGNLSSIRFWMVDPSDATNNADSFFVNIPNGRPSSTTLFNFAVDYDAGVPSGILLDEDGFISNVSTSGLAPITFNENIANDGELLTRFRDKFDEVIAIANNGNAVYASQEFRTDDTNIEAVILDTYPGNQDDRRGQSTYLSTVQGNAGNFTATTNQVDALDVTAHRVGIDTNVSNSLYGGWVQSQRLSRDILDDDFNVGVNGIYDQDDGNFDIYGSRQFTVADTSNPNIFNIVPVNSSNTDIVSSNFILSDLRGEPQTGTVFISSVGPITFTGDFYEQTGPNSNPVRLTEGIGLTLQYKEITG